MKRNAFAIQTRRDQIRERLRESGSVSVGGMSQVFNVSESTIRRDLEIIKDAGAVRIHGGMRLERRESGFEEKRRVSARIKDAVAAEAAGIVKDGQTVFLNAGTTTLALFRLIRDRDICIVTNNVMAVAEPDSMRAELILVGGEYRSRTRSLVGGMAKACLAQVYADLCFLGANGMSLERGLTTALHQEVEVNRAMGEGARRVACLADSSKIGVDAGFVSLPLSMLSDFFTDSGAEPEAMAALRRLGIGVTLAGAGRGWAAPAGGGD